MVCMSPSSSTKIINELADSYNKDVLLWTDEIGKVNMIMLYEPVFLYFCIIEC